MRLALLFLALAGLCVWTAQILGAVNIEAAPAHELPRAEAARPHSGGALAATDGEHFLDAPPPPLFRPAIAPQPQQPQSGEHFELIGLTGEGASRTAFLRDAVDRRTFTVRTGMSVAAWSIAEIGERCVQLRRARSQQNVCLS